MLLVAFQIDIYFFIRPFTTVTWLCIALTTVVILILVVLPYHSLSIYPESNSYTIGETSAWVFFTLLNAYYSGAMTMFFTAEFEMPVTDLR